MSDNDKNAEETDKLIVEFLNSLRLDDESDGSEDEEMRDESYSLSGTNDGHLVFVYGSLKRGFGNHSIIRHSGGIFLGQGRTAEKKFDMLSMSAFPACYIGGEYHIAGELYAVDNRCLGSLDMLEGNGHFYTRKEVMVEITERDGLGTASFKVPAWMYLVDRPEREGHWFASSHHRDNEDPGSDTLDWNR